MGARMCCALLWLMIPSDIEVHGRREVFEAVRGLSVFSVGRVRYLKESTSLIGARRRRRRSDEGREDRLELESENEKRDLLRQVIATR